MLGTFTRFARQVRRPAFAAVATAAMVLPALTTRSSAGPRVAPKTSPTSPKE